MNAKAGGASVRPAVVTMGNPNTGKSTLFNLLTGMSQKVSNYPGVTVEQVSGHVTLGDANVQLIDVPGTYSLAAHSPDEKIAVDVLCGNVEGMPLPDAVLIVVDATNLRRNLFLATQILEAGLPTVIALNMTDRLQAVGLELDIGKIQMALGVPVVPVSATDSSGIDELRRALEQCLREQPRPKFVINADIDAAVSELAQRYPPQHGPEHTIELRRALLDAGGYAEQCLVARHGTETIDVLAQLREQIGAGRGLSALEARDRYSWIQQLLNNAITKSELERPNLSDRIDAVANHPIAGSLLFVFVMALVFQAVFSFSAPLVDAIDVVTGSLASQASSMLGPGLVGSFVSEGVIAGVGSVIVFLPQIVILFAFIIVLEDSGYMARAAFMMDRAMRGLGLSGQSFIPMLSSFACAVPGIMGTRIIAHPTDRLATIVAAPFMTCSARLPVYSLLIAAFLPETRYLGGLVNLQGLVLLGLYLLGISGGALTAFAMNRLLSKRGTTPFLLEMPPYRRPRVRPVMMKILNRAWIFLKRAGTIIFSVALIIWLLVSFPRLEIPGQNGTDAPAFETSYLGRVSHAITPVFAPLGWDWKVTASVVASFPAREVVIAALGTIYAVDPDSADDSATLTERIQQAVHADGSPVYTLPMVVGLLIFYAFCLQCVSTMAVMRRETGTWRWPLCAWVYMTSLGYLGALLSFQIGTRLAAV